MKAILFGPFVGELYWEIGRFAPMLPFYKFKKYKNQNIKYIILTRKERFDLYGENADILVSLKIEGDYQNKNPNCFRLDGFNISKYSKLVNQFKKQYSNKYNIIEHIYPDISKKQFINKNQFNRKNMLFQYKPRNDNYILVNKFINNNKPNVILSPRYRKGFKRNWNKWPEFYNTLSNNEELMNNFNFIITGKPGEYIPDKKNRFYDMNNININDNSSLIGILLALMEKSIFVFGSQSAIPNIGLIYKKEVLEFGCQKLLHTKTYNIFNTPVTFIDNKNYDIDVKIIFKKFKQLLIKYKRK
jgi:hypothetical protein